MVKSKKSLKKEWTGFKRTTPRSTKFDTWSLNKIHGRKYVYNAPDGSSISKFQDLRYGGLAHCRLPPQKTSYAQKHRNVDEIWYCIHGIGEVWRKQGKRQKIVRIRKNDCLTIPTNTHFQFRTIGKEPLEFVIATLPPWPGPGEAIRVEDHWKTKNNS